MDKTKSIIYKHIYDSKFFFKVVKKSEYEIKIPKTSLDKILSLYGNEKILPLSFIYFCNLIENKETVINTSENINLRSTMQINKILSSLSTLLIYPASYEGLDEKEKIRLSPKLKNKHLQNISKKMGIDFSDMINYLSLQIVSVQLKESIKMIKSLEIYIRIFNNIHLLGVKFLNKEKFPITYYSYKNILNMCGISIDKILPLFDIKIIPNITREDILNYEKHILYDKVLEREIKESIDENIKEEKINIYKGSEQCKRIPKPKYDDMEYFREKESNLISKLKNSSVEGIIEIKKDEINDNEINNQLEVNKEIKKTNKKNKNDIHNEEENMIDKKQNKNKEINHNINNDINNDNINQPKEIINEIKKNNLQNKDEYNIIKQVEENENMGKNEINQGNNLFPFEKENEKIQLKNNDKSTIEENIRNKLDLDKFVSNNNSSQRKKFKIRRAVFIKVEKNN